MWLGVVPEEITSRFWKVISLFNGFIPIVAIQVTALELKQQGVPACEHPRCSIMWHSRTAEEDAWRTNRPQLLGEAINNAGYETSG